MVARLVGVDSILDDFLPLRASQASSATDQVIGGHRQSKFESQACDPAQQGPRETTNGLGPAERLLRALAHRIADRRRTRAHRKPYRWRAEAACSRRIAHDHQIWAASRSTVPVADEPDRFQRPGDTSRARAHALAGLASSMTCTGCLATDDNEAAHSWAWLQQFVQRAQHGVARCALFAGHCLAPSVQTALSVCEIMIEQPQLRQRDWRRLA
jgi:hypothetical protein